MPPAYYTVSCLARFDIFLHVAKFSFCDITNGYSTVIAVAAISRWPL